MTSLLSQKYCLRVFIELVSIDLAPELMHVTNSLTCISQDMENPINITSYQGILFIEEPPYGGVGVGVGG